MTPSLTSGTDRQTAPIQIGRPLQSLLPILNIARHLDIPVADPDDLHVTLTWSRHSVDWSKDVFQPRAYPLFVNPQMLGVACLKNLAVLTFQSQALQARHASLRAAGARPDYEGYIPHITLGPWEDHFEERQVQLETPLLLGPEYRKPAKIEKSPAP
jgi:hypothetical protein